METEPQCAELLRRLALGNERAVTSIMSSAAADVGPTRLEDKVRALLRIAALIAGDSAAASYQWTVSVARAAGTTDEEVVAVLSAIAPIVGSARVTLAASSLASALGYELDAIEDS